MIFFFRSSECSTSVSSVTRRSSIRPIAKTEKYSGIKCSLPSFTPTVPTAFKGLEKHYTPVRSQLTSSLTSASLMVRRFSSSSSSKSQPNFLFQENQMTPASTNGRDKSPWRLRFEKFLNHQEPTPISPTRNSVTLNDSKVRRFLLSNSVFFKNCRINFAFLLECNFGQRESNTLISSSSTTTEQM